MKIIDKLAWIEIKERKILSTRTIGKEVFYIPGGKREGSETDFEALTREINEELDVHLITESLRYFGVFEAQADGKDDGIIVKMTCYMGEYIGTLTPSTEIESIAWFTYEDRSRSSAVDKIIFEYCKQNNLID